VKKTAALSIAKWRTGARSRGGRSRLRIFQTPPHFPRRSRSNIKAMYFVKYCQCVDSHQFESLLKLAPYHPRQVPRRKMGMSMRWCAVQFSHTPLQRFNFHRKTLQSTVYFDYRSMIVDFEPTQEHLLRISIAFNDQLI
jgi:hypothetical protein